MKDYRVFLHHIQDAIEKIDRYTRAGRRTFMSDTMVQDAVIRNLEIIGEAVPTESQGADSACWIQRFTGGHSLPNLFARGAGESHAPHDGSVLSAASPAAARCRTPAARCR